MVERRRKEARKVYGFDLEYSDVRLDHVAGYEDVKAAVRAILRQWRDPEKAAKYGLRDDLGLFLYGPGGTGKTLIAKAVAGELDLPYVYVKVEEIMGTYVGESAANMARLFDTLRAEPAVVAIFDELDSLLGTTNSRSETEAKDQARTTFKQQLASRDPAHRLFIVGTTNRPWTISAAELRRIGEPRFVGLPNTAARHRLFELFLQELKSPPLAPDVDFGVLADEADGFSGDDIQKICESAARSAADETDEGVRVSMSHLRRAMRSKSRTVSQDELEQFLEYERRITGGGPHAR